MTRERVLVAMSGGVDSSVAAALLVEQGYDVIGATMKLFCYGDEVPDRPCCSLDSIDDARRVCEKLGVPHYVLNMEDAFGRDVLQNFVDEYARGRTPIPCVRCNSFTKFRDLLHKADALDAQWIATGHYARAWWRAVEGIGSGEGSELLPVGDRSRGGEPDAAAGRRADEGGDAGAGAGVGTERRSGEAGEPGHLLRAGWGSHRCFGEAFGEWRCGVVARAVPAERWATGWRARGVRAIYDRAAAGAAGWIRGADVRDWRFGRRIARW